MTDFTFPVYGFKLQEIFRKEFKYTGIIESPGIAYVINMNYGTEISTSLVRSVLESWPLFAVSALLAYLAAFAVWITVRNVSHLNITRMVIAIMQRSSIKIRENSKGTLKRPINHFIK